MVEAALVEVDFDEGEALVRALDKSSLRVTAAFWSYFPEAESYRLILSSPQADSKGPLLAYAEIQALIAKLRLTLTLDRVSVVSPADPVVRALTSAIRVAPFGRVRVKSSNFNGVHFEDALIYRAEPAVKAPPSGRLRGRRARNV